MLFISDLYESGHNGHDGHEENSFYAGAEAGGIEKGKKAEPSRSGFSSGHSEPIPSVGNYVYWHKCFYSEKISRCTWH